MHVEGERSETVGVFMGRVSLFSCLWLMLILFDSNYIPFSISLFAVSFAFFCLLSLQKHHIYFYVVLSVIAILHMWTVGTEQFYIITYLYFLVVDATFRLQGYLLKGYLIVNFVISILYTILIKDFIIEVILLHILFVSLILVGNRIFTERQELRQMYEQLLGEFRKNKRMNASADREARLEERTNIARDIHDSVGHRLTALMMKIEILSIQNKERDYEELKIMAKEALKETREAVKALHQEEIQGVASVVQLIRKLEAESQLMVKFTMKQGVLSVALTNKQSITLYRAIQEALTNVMRHSSYREVQVELGKSAVDDVTFEIRNRILQARQFVVGFGLTNMRKRIEEIHGKLHIYQTEQHFVVVGTIPCVVKEIEKHVANSSC